MFCDFHRVAWSNDTQDTLLSSGNVSELGMLNNNQKFDYWFFYCSCFRKQSSRLSFSNSTGVATNVIILAATISGVYNCVTSHTEALTPSVECGKWKLWKSETHCAICCPEGRRVVLQRLTYRRTRPTSQQVLSVIVWTEVVCFSRHRLAADNLHRLSWISEHSRACADHQLLSHWLMKPHILGLATAYHTVMDVSPPHTKTLLTSLHYGRPTCTADFIHQQILAWPFALCHC